MILDGGGCTGCNVLEMYGNYVHIESLTIQNATRAIRFQTPAHDDNVVRRVHIGNVALGIGSQPDQQDFYIGDNILEGRLVVAVHLASDERRSGGQQACTPTTTASTSRASGHVVATTGSPASATR